MYDGSIEQLNFKANPDDVVSILCINVHTQDIYYDLNQDPMSRNQDADQYVVFDPRAENPKRKDDRMNDHTRRLYTQKKLDKW
jgi:hypothetical protein